MRVLARTFRRFLQYRRTLLAGVVCIPLASLGDIGITIVVGNALDRLRAASDAEFLRGMVLLLMGIALARGVFRFLQRWWIVCVSRYVERDLKQELFDRLVTLSFAFHNHSRSGDLVSRLTSDVENVRMFLGPGLMYTLGALVMVPVSLGYLFVLNAPMAAWMLLPLAIMGLGMRLLAPRLHRHSSAVQESLADIGHRAQENFAGIRVVKGYGRERQQTARFDADSRANRGHQIELGRARGLTQAITWGSKDLTFLPIVLVGGWAMIDRALPAGDLFKFIDLTYKVFWPIIAVGWMAGVYPRAVVSAGRVEDLLGSDEEIADPPGARELEDVRGELALEDVGFRYPGSERAALEGITVAVPAGGVLGVVGPTGAGKTTLLNLLARLYECEGTIRLDGVDIAKLSLASLRGALGYVPQDSFLFSATFRENVSFGVSEDLDDAALAELVERAALTEEVAGFPDGFDQHIGERGVTLSGGQRQRTCIARALARDPAVLVLDDALSAVDSETESRLIESLEAAGRGRTVVLAAHRLSSVRHADRILVLVDGRPQAVGTHAELIARPGWYADTWRRQESSLELAEL
ncbi:MAG TPA: ABC transporter ATP-binding protein [Planctomycetota bacterium]|nr:ABC transporter ATP-binding protein [Planctomycetota bacterium]